MHISRLALDHYRSWDHCVLDFEPGINILQGSNGLGKTNIVEAVEVLSTGSSHRTSSSLPLVEKGHPSATARANVEDAGEQRTYEITIAARGANSARGRRKIAIYEGYRGFGPLRVLYPRRPAVGVWRSGHPKELPQPGGFAAVAPLCAVVATVHARCQTACRIAQTAV